MKLNYIKIYKIINKFKKILNYIQKMDIIF